MDSQIGEILKSIETAGWSKDSLIIANLNQPVNTNIVVDHGGIGYGHGENITNMDCPAIILNALDVDIPSWFDAKLPI
ncbi:hypothetical protein C1645_821267 [Glomus cerebriforme]|uniref:Uncharacterized protein n=1 Tax=Glomus cerebriforme TaxID=658196 RepID=A0A397T0M3_9GLOM|nr:hypothetical protein C1645_821267 [Glomus cerebriforme]